MAAAYFMIESGPQARTRVELTKASTKLGRDRGKVDFVLGERPVSREHIEVVRDEDAYFITDLNSTGGTKRNGRALRPGQPERLRDGDRIQVVMHELVFHDPHSRTPGPRPEMVDDGSGTDSGSTVQSQLDADLGSAILSVAVSPDVKLRVMFEITRELGRTLTLDAVLPRVLDSLFGVFRQADHGFIILLDERGELVPRWTKSRRSDEDSVRISQTVIRRVLESRQAELLRVLPGDPAITDSIRGVGSVICAPLLDSSGNAIGAIHLDTLDRRKAFHPDDLELLVSVAVQASMAIENAQFHEWSILRQRMEHDLQLANEVQRAFLPKSPPTIAGYDFFDHYRSARLVGGDYYDYVELPDGSTAILVADVAGKGVAAAMVMARVSAEAKFCLATEAGPGVAMNKLNDRMCRLQLERFVTMVMLVLDPRTHRVTIVNAGHMPPLRRHADGTVEDLGTASSGMPLGIVPGNAYEETAISLAPGESLTLYTDGVQDATNEKGELYQVDRILGHVRDSGSCVQTLGRTLIDDVQRFMGDRPQFDDICLVCLGRLCATTPTAGCPAPCASRGGSDGR